MKLKINFFSFFSIFLILFYSFNVGLIHIIYPNDIIKYGSLFFSSGILMLLAINNKIDKKKLISIATVIFAIILILLIRNADIKQGAYKNIIVYITILASFFSLMLSDKWFKSFKIILLIFIIEHLVATWIFNFFPSIYYKYIIHLFKPSDIRLLLSQFGRGYAVGLSRHYSHNGMYLSIGVLYFYCMMLKQKNWKNIFMLFLSFGGLLLTGKRGHFIFVIATMIVIMYIVNRKNFIKFTKKIIAIILVGIIAYFIASKFIPTISNTLFRFSKLSDTDDITNGRTYMYNLMINMWKRNPLFGNGWGAVKYQNISMNNGHNVYLQILAECGIFGELFFLFIIAKIFSKSVKLCKSIDNSSEYKFYILFSTSMQIFFALYCITGNPLYDVQVLYPFILSIASVFYIDFKIHDDDGRINE